MPMAWVPEKNFIKELYLRVGSPFCCVKSPPLRPPTLSRWHRTSWLGSYTLTALDHRKKWLVLADVGGVEGAGSTGRGHRRGRSGAANTQERGTCVQTRGFRSETDCGVQQETRLTKDITAGTT